MSVRIRDATPEDCQKIIDLIQELADYEKMPHGPQLCENDLIRDGFPSDSRSPRLFRSKVAECGGEVIGYCLYYHSWSFQGPSFYLEDIYVTPSKRRNGIGRMFFGAIAEDVLNNNGTALRFSVLGWNEPAISFYGKIGALDRTADRGLHVYRFTRQIMAELGESNVLEVQSDEQPVDIRPATEKDCGIICNMIHDFVTEQLGAVPKEALPTASELSKHAFPSADDAGASHGNIRLMVATKSSTVIGYAWTFTSYSTWEGPSTWLKNLFVVPAERNSGVGRRLLLEVMKKETHRGSARLDLVAESNKPEIVRFYRRLGAVDITEAEDWHYFKTPVDVLKTLASERQ